MKLKSFIYVTGKNTVIRIKSKKRPSLETVRQSGTWVVNELNKGEWEMPCFPEITWYYLNQFIYLGILDEVKKEQDLIVRIK